MSEIAGGEHRNGEESGRHPDRQRRDVSRRVKGLVRCRYRSPLTGRAAPWTAFGSVWDGRDATTGAAASRPC